MAELSPEVSAEVEETIEHFNANHADSVLFVARFAAGFPEADDAEIVAIDRSGVDLAVVIGDAQQRARLAFAQPVAAWPEVQAGLLGGLMDARSNAGPTVALTSLEVELKTNPGLPTLVSTVVGLRDLSPNLREVVVEGGLSAFESLGGDQFVYLMVPRDFEQPVPDDWSMADHRAAGADSPMWGGYYTVRDWDAERYRLTFWVVRHGHDEGVGGWAGACQVGDRVALWGPRHGFDGTSGAESVLFVTDESGLAAVAVLLEELPPACRAVVIAETVDESHELAMPIADSDITWIHRGDSEPGTGSALFESVAAVDPRAEGWVAFGAGESRQMTQIRKYLRHEVGMSSSQVFVTGYWRLG